MTVPTNQHPGWRSSVVWNGKNAKLQGQNRRSKETKSGTKKGTEYVVNNTEEYERQEEAGTQEYRLDKDLSGEPAGVTTTTKRKNT